MPSKELGRSNPASDSTRSCYIQHPTYTYFITNSWYMPMLRQSASAGPGYQNQSLKMAAPRPFYVHSEPKRHSQTNSIRVSGGRCSSRRRRRSPSHTIYRLYWTAGTEEIHITISYDCVSFKATIRRWPYSHRHQVVSHWARTFSPSARAKDTPLVLYCNFSPISRPLANL